MNKTMTRLLFWSIFLLIWNKSQAQITGVGTTGLSKICPGSTVWINKATTETYPYTYQYWNGTSWACCFGGNQTPYEFSVPHTGQLVEVQRQYSNGQTVVKTESVGVFYSPLVPVIDHLAQPSTCNTNTGSIKVKDLSNNFAGMPRIFKLYNQGNGLLDTKEETAAEYTFNNLPAGSYKVVIETGCSGMSAERSGIVVSSIGQNPSLSLDFSGDDDCQENNISASIILPESIPSTNVQYKLDDGAWQSSNTFTDLSPWQQHQFYARLQGCFEAQTSQFVSELRLPRIEGLERAKDTDCIPANNEIRVFAPEGSDAQVQYNQNGSWYNTGQWVGPLPDGTLHIRVRSAYLHTCYRDTSITLSEHGSVSLVGADVSNTADCIAGNIQLQIQTNPSVSADLEYFVEGKGWQSSRSFNGLSVGDKGIAIRSTGLCQVLGLSADTLSLSEIIPPQIAAIVPHGHEDCVAGNAGFTVQLSQSVSGVRFRINGGAWQEGNLFTNLSAGSYMVEVSRSDGSCVSGQSFGLVETGSVSISGITRFNENDCVVGNAWFQVLHTGGNQEGLKFRLNGGAWQDSAIFRNLNRMAVLVEAQVQKVGCTSAIVAWADSIREESNFPEVASIAISNDKDCTVGNAKVTFTLKVPMTTTYWLSPVKNNTTGVFTGLSTGTYTFKVYKNSNGCVQTHVVVIDEKMQFAPDSLTVLGANDCVNGNAALVIHHPYGGNAGWQFREVNRNTAWQSSNVFSVDQYGGQYDLQARNVNGCTVWSGSTYVQERSHPEVSGVSIQSGATDCILGNVSGQLQVSNSSSGSSKQYRINGVGDWSPYTGFSNLRHGLNRVEMSWYYNDGWGSKQCSSSKDIYIDEKVREITGVMLDASTLNDCTPNNVKATIQVDGASSNLRYVVTGKTEGTSNIFTNLNNGQYRAIIRDVVTSCRDTFNFSVAETPVLNIPSPSVQAVLCHGANTGSIGVSPTGGVAPYTYLWSNGRSSASISGLAAGTYTVSVTDSRGCIQSQSVGVPGPAQNNLPQITFSGDTVICAGSNFTLSASGGNTYAWSTGASASSISGSPDSTTIYTVTVTDTQGCSSTASQSVRVNALPNPSIEGINVICAGQSTTLTATGGSAYAWQHGPTTASITVNPTSTTTYKVTVTNAEGCSDFYNRTLRVNPLPIAQINGGAALSPICGSGVVWLTATGGHTYHWSTGETSASISQSLNASASFGVTVKSVEGCTASASASVVVIPRPYAQITGGDIACRGNSTSLTASGGSSYLWSNNATSSSISIHQPTQNQTYSVTVSNGPNCFDVASKTIVVPDSFKLGYTLAGEQDCILNNTEIIPLPQHAQGLVTYVLNVLNPFEFSTHLQGWSSGQYYLSGIDAKGCMAGTAVNIQEPDLLQVAAQISGDSSDCQIGNVQVQLSSTGAHGAVSYHFDAPQSALLTPANFNSSTMQRWVYAVDTVGCVDSVEVEVRDTTPGKLITGYTQSLDRDCIYGNANIELNLSPSAANLPLHFQLNRNTVQQTPAFDSLRSGLYLIRAWYQDCRDSVEVLIDERIPRITGFQYLHHDDCKPNNTGVKIQAISGWGTLRYRFDQGSLQDSSVFDSLPGGRYRFTVTDSLQCQDSLYITINSEQPAYISVEDLTQCDSAVGRISFRPNTQGVAAQYSIDGGKHWQTQVKFDSLPPGIYHPLRRKVATGCIDSLREVVLGRQCDTIPIAYFLQDTIRITSPNEIALIRWELKAPKWYREDFYVKMRLASNGFPHFNDGSLATVRTPELRGSNPPQGPNLYRYSGGGIHRDSVYVPLQDSAHLYTYPADYYFTLSTPEGGKTVVDPDRDITRVTVSLLGPEVTPEGKDVKILCKEEECVAIGEEEVTGANCYYWPEFPEPGKKVQTVCQPGQYTRMALDENLRVIEKTVFTVKKSDLSVKINAKLAVPFACNNPDDSSLEAVVTANASNGPITFKWSTGETTQSIKLRFTGSTYKVTVTQGDCNATAEYMLPNTCNSEQVKEFFEENGFFAIPITNVQKIALHTPEQRTACPQPVLGANNVKDFARVTFEVNSGQVNPLSQLDEALGKFKSVFKYGAVSGLITSNDEVCACPNYLNEKKAEFSTGSGLQFWYHIFKQDLNCPEVSCDLLFIKAKMPNGKTYPAGAQDVAFLATGYDFFTRVIENSGESLLSIMDDLCLDNFAAAKNPEMFEHKVPKQPLENLHLDLSGACWKGFNQAPVAVFTPSGELVMLPDNAVWRFRTPEKVAYAEGALTGFTKVTFDSFTELFEVETQYISDYKPDPLSCAPPFALKKLDIGVPKVNAKWTEIWEARTFANDPSKLEGYFRLNGLIGPFGFQQPTEAQEKGRVYRGDFVDMHGTAGNCEEFYVISSAKLSDQDVFATYPTGSLVADIGTKGYEFKGERHYTLCPSEIGDLAATVHKNSPDGAVYIFAKTTVGGTLPGLRYQFYDPVYGKSWAYLTPEGNGTKQTLWVWNCRLATWQEVKDEEECNRIRGHLTNIDEIWPILVKRAGVHSGLELLSFIPLLGSGFQAVNGIIYIKEGQVDRGVAEIVIAGIGVALEVPGINAAIFAGRIGGAGQFITSLDAYKLTPIELPPGQAIACNEVRYAVEIQILLESPVLGKIGSKLGTAGTTVLTKIDEGIIKLIQNQEQGWPVLKWLNSMGTTEEGAEAAANILKKVFGELDFTVDEFAKLVDEFTSNAAFKQAFDNNEITLEAWFRIHKGIPELKARQDYLSYLKKMSLYQKEKGRTGTIRYYRVQGGTGTTASQYHVQIDGFGNVTIADVTLNISIGDLEHARYFQSLRPGSQIYSFEVPRSLDDQIKASSVPQFKASSNTFNTDGNAPKLVDPTTPGHSFELPAVWAQILEDNYIPGSGRIEN